MTSPTPALLRRDTGDKLSPPTSVHPAAPGPIAVFVELTRGCNLCCPMCRQERASYSTTTMSASLFSRVAEQLFPTAAMVDLRGWGESLLLREFPSRALTVREHGCMLRIVTNLSFRNDVALRALAESNATVSVSLDSTDREALRQVRGGAELGLITANLASLRAYYRDSGSDFNRVYIGATVQRQTIGHMSGVVQAAAEQGIRSVAFFPRQNQGDIHPLDDDERLRLLHDIEACHRVAERACVNVRIGAKLWHGMRDNLPPFDFACVKPWSYCFVDYQGTVGFCDFLMGPGWEQHGIGSLIDQEFQELWNGRRWTEVRRRHLEGSLHTWPVTRSCEWCYTNRYVDFEDSVDARYAPRVLTPAAMLSAHQHIQT